MNEESLFAAALEKATAAERQAFLEEACAGDVALRRRVERLLAAHERPSASSTSRPARRVGRRTPSAPTPAAPRGRTRRHRGRRPLQAARGRSAKAAWARSGWPSRRSRSAARSP